MSSATLFDRPARAEAARDAAMTAHAERAEQGAPPPSPGVIPHRSGSSSVDL
ncbi:hypothetical protein [Sorangium sp. So ce1097]|uniref:hypothetical protein n=1 Tax=Sorangium sp. So ce1097 TaxID=3133330 RepID=UPI003F5FB05F